MDFLTTARFLIDIQKDHPDMRYGFEDGLLIIRIPVDSDVPEHFDNAKRMFDPA